MFFLLLKAIYNFSYPVIAFTRYEWQDWLATIFLQAFPAFIMDFFNTEKIRLLAVCRKVQSMKNVMQFFLNKKLYFDNKNVVEKVYDRYVYIVCRFQGCQTRKLIWFRYSFLECPKLIRNYFRLIRAHSIGSNFVMHILWVFAFI